MTDGEMILKIIEIVVSGLLLPLATWGISALASWLKAKTKSEKTKAAISYAQSIVDKSVNMVFQTYVDELKAKGEFDISAQKEALRRALEAEKEMLSEEAKALIEEYSGNLEVFLVAATECAVRNYK